MEPCRRWRVPIMCGRCAEGSLCRAFGLLGGPGINGGNVEEAEAALNALLQGDLRMFGDFERFILLDGGDEFGIRFG